MNETDIDMQTEVKRFVAPTMSRALELVREEMGPEAIILSSQKVADGIEIVTSIERDLPTRGVSERRSFGQNFDTELDHAMESDVSWQSQAGVEQAAAYYPSQLELNGPSEPKQRPLGEDLAAEIERARERMMAAKREAAAGAQSVASPIRKERVQPLAPEQPPSELNAHLDKANPALEVDNKRKLEDLRGEIADLRMLLEQQMWQKKDALSTVVETGVQGESQSSILTEHMARLGISDRITAAVCRGIEDGSRLSDAWKQGLAKLSRQIPIANEMDTSKGGVFAFIGPTGVGKTTTLAKLAAQYTVENGPGKVALVSMDTHRVGAIEQLRALGRILDVPVRTVSPANSLMTVLSELRDFPLVLVDTAGFRHGDAMLKAQLAQLDQNPSVRRLLVMSCLSQLQTMKASVHAYRPRAQMDACVITKLDEAASLGEAISVVIEHKLDVAYVTDGQQIPTDAHLATAHRLVATAVSLAKKYASVLSASQV